MRQSTVIEVFQRCFYAFTLRYASLSCFKSYVTFCDSLIGKELTKQQTRDSKPVS